MVHQIGGEECRFVARHAGIGQADRCLRHVEIERDALIEFRVDLLDRRKLRGGRQRAEHTVELALERLGIDRPDHAHDQIVARKQAAMKRRQIVGAQPGQRFGRALAAPRIGMFAIDRAGPGDIRARSGVALARLEPCDQLGADAC
jgi:hypothetical protein